MRGCTILTNLKVNLGFLNLCQSLSCMRKKTLFSLPFQVLYSFWGCLNDISKCYFGFWLLLLCSLSAGSHHSLITLWYDLQGAKYITYNVSFSVCESVWDRMCVFCFFPHPGRLLRNWQCICDHCQTE